MNYDLRITICDLSSLKSERSVFAFSTPAWCRYLLCLSHIKSGRSAFASASAFYSPVSGLRSPVSFNLYPFYPSFIFRNASQYPP